MVVLGAGLPLLLSLFTVLGAGLPLLLSLFTVLGAGFPLLLSLFTILGAGLPLALSLFTILLLVKMHVSERVANFVCIFTVDPLCWACLGCLFMRKWPIWYTFLRSIHSVGMLNRFCIFKVESWNQSWKLKSWKLKPQVESWKVESWKVESWNMRFYL